MTAIHRLFTAAGLVLAMVVALPAAATVSQDGPASCTTLGSCEPQVSARTGTCPSPKPPAA